MSRLFVDGVGLVLGFAMTIMIRFAFAVGVWLRSMSGLMNNSIVREVRGTRGPVSTFNIAVSDLPTTLNAFVLSLSDYKGQGAF